MPAPANYDLHRLQKMRSNIRAGRDRLTEIRSGAKQLCKPSMASIFCSVVPGRQPETRV